MLLASIASLKQRVNAPNLGTVDARCGALLEAATNYVAAYLYTDFTKELGVTDRFRLRSADYRARTSTLKLELGFNLVRDGAITCTVAPSMRAAVDGLTSEVDALDYEVDRTTGIVYLHDMQACGQVVSVTYDKGLDVVNDGTYDVAQNVPSWLADAALMTAAYHYILPSIESTEQLCGGLPCEARQLLEPYRRNWQNAYQKAGV